MTPTIPDITTEPKPPTVIYTAPAWKRRLPWALAGVLAVALALSLAPPRPAPAPITPAPPPEVLIVPSWSEGWSDGPTLLRDSAGQPVASMIVVRPLADEAVWCRITVDGELVVEVHATDGNPATCLWARDAA